MFKYQYQDIKEENGICNGKELPSDVNIHLYINSGKHKGKIGRLVSINHGNCDIRVDEETVSLLYTKVDIPDKDGNPVIGIVKDITGRKISLESIITYSVNAGDSSHALEIGKVTKITTSGNLTVKPIIRNGIKLFQGRWDKSRVCIKSERTLLLPVDSSMVTIWILSDFEVYKANELVE